MSLSMCALTVKWGEVNASLWVGNDVLLMFTAFIAGCFWGNRGLQLTLGMVTILSVAITVRAFLVPEQVSLDVGHLSFSFPTRSDGIFPLLMFSALLYALLGKKLAHGLAQRRSRGLGFGANG